MAVLWGIDKKPYQAFCVPKSNLIYSVLVSKIEMDIWIQYVSEGMDKQPCLAILARKNGKKKPFKITFFSEFGCKEAIKQMLPFGAVVWIVTQDEQVLCIPRRAYFVNAQS